MSQVEVGNNMDDNQVGLRESLRAKFTRRISSNNVKHQKDNNVKQKVHVFEKNKGVTINSNSNSNEDGTNNNTKKWSTKYSPRKTEKEVIRKSPNSPNKDESTPRKSDNNNNKRKLSKEDNKPKDSNHHHHHKNVNFNSNSTTENQGGPSSTIAKLSKKPRASGTVQIGSSRHKKQRKRTNSGNSGNSGANSLQQQPITTSSNSESNSSVSTSSSSSKKDKSHKTKSSKKKSISKPLYTADVGIIEALLDKDEKNNERVEDLLYTTDLNLNNEEEDDDDDDDSDSDDLESSSQPPSQQTPKQVQVQIQDSLTYTSDDVDFIGESSSPRKEGGGGSNNNKTINNYTLTMVTDEQHPMYTYDIDGEGGELVDGDLAETKDPLLLQRSLRKESIGVSSDLPLYTADLDEDPFESANQNESNSKANAKSSSHIKSSNNNKNKSVSDNSNYTMYESDLKPEDEQEAENSYTRYTDAGTEEDNTFQKKQQRKALLYSTNIPKNFSQSYTESLEIIPGYTALIESPNANDNSSRSKPDQKKKKTPLKFKIINDKKDFENGKQQSTSQNNPKAATLPISKLINSSDIKTLKYLLTEIAKTTDIDNDSPQTIPIDSSIIQSKFLSILTNPEFNIPNEDQSKNFKMPVDQRSWAVEWFQAFQSLKGWDVYTLEQDFSFLATSTAKTIIREIPLPLSQKTIQPVNIGGVAGGTKYIKNGIIYKLATDVNLGQNTWMYGGTSGASDEYAIKAAGRELNGLATYITASLKVNHGGNKDETGCTPGKPVSMRFPLMILIDYCGYRILAMSLLPILGKGSLIYGSCDGGATVEASNETVNDAMKQIGHSLGLAGHKVGGKHIYGPGDFEIHSSSNPEVDGSFYALDFARLMPPEAPSPVKSIRMKEPRSVFYKLLRPSLVANWSMQNEHRGLSSDAFTGWGKDDPNRIAQCQDVINATKSLYDECIPQFVTTFGNSVMWSTYVGFRSAGVSCESGQAIDEATESRFLMEMSGEFMILAHCVGVNFRHLGRVRKSVHQNYEDLKNKRERERNDYEDNKNLWMEELVMSLTVARGLKNIIKQEFRDVFKLNLNQTNTKEDKLNHNKIKESEQPYKEIVVKYLNLLFNYKDNDVKNRSFWCDFTDSFQLKSFLNERYRDLFISDYERSDQCDIRSLCNMKLVYIYLNHILGTQLRESISGKSIWKELAANETLNIQRILFFKTDIVSISERVRGAGFSNLTTGIKAFGDFKYLYTIRKRTTALGQEENREDRVKEEKSLDYATNSLNRMFMSHPICPLTNLYSGISYYYSSKAIPKEEKCKAKWFLLQSMMRLEYAWKADNEQNREAAKYVAKVYKQLKLRGLHAELIGFQDKEEYWRAKEQSVVDDPHSMQAKSVAQRLWEGNRDWELF